MRLLKGCILLLIAVSQTHCMWMASTPNGIREFYRGNNGLVVTGKASPDMDDAYHKTQRYSEAIKISIGGDNNDRTE